MFNNMLNVIPVKAMYIDDIIKEWHKYDEDKKFPYQNYDSYRESYGFYINFGEIDDSLPEDK